MPPPNRRIVGLSTKMYFSLAQTRAWVARILELLADVPAAELAQIDVFIVPDFVALAPTVAQLRAAGAAVWAGAQDCHVEDHGPFTGDVSPAVLAEAGARIVEVGHAERRRLYGEDDATVAAKAAAVARHAMVPLVCVGEATRAAATAAVAECRVQVEAALAALPGGADVVLAYEPVWAIGASSPAPEAHVLDVVAGIRSFECVRARAGATRIVYGGSAGPGLFGRLSGGLDGLFLGRFGHDAERFVETVREVMSA